MRFLSTPSARRATREERAGLTYGAYFYPRPPRGGRRRTASVLYRVSPFLSTPSVRRATLSCTAYRRPTSDFYPRPPRGGRRCLRSVSSCSTAFLSTPSARRATSVLDTSVTATVFLSTPSARRATLRRALPDDLRRGISIHALREEGDKPTVNGTRHTDRFLSTPSARRATVGNDAQAQDIEISIHALREEGDVIFCFNSASAC